MQKQRKLLTAEDIDKIDISEICPPNSKLTLISQVPVYSFFKRITGNTTPDYWNLIFEIEPLTSRPVPVIQTIELIDHQKTGQLVRRYRQNLGVSIKLLAKYTIEKHGFSEIYLELLERGDRPWTEKTFELILNSIDTIVSQQDTAPETSLQEREVENVN